MPYCEIGNGIRIFYRRYGHGRTKALFITGLAGTHDSWGPQLKGLVGSHLPNEEEEAAAPPPADGDGIEACCFDNRGMGLSSVPTNKLDYSTTIMARDALTLLDHIGWKKAHVFGHSMGSMIACKLAAMAPDRLYSLALMNATGGGFECIPKIDRQMISLAYRFLNAKTPEQRAHVDLETHYSKEYLDEYVGSSTRRKILYQQYVKAISNTGMQSNYGFEGQIHACWTHNLKSEELGTIRSSGFPVSVIHGRYDIIAQLTHARKLAEKLQPSARMVELHGGHLVAHERPDEVNQSLMELIKESKSNRNREDWSNVPRREPRWHLAVISLSLNIRSNERASYLVAFYNLLGKLKLTFLYIMGLLLLGFEYTRKIVKMIKPTRVLT